MTPLFGIKTNMNKYRYLFWFIGVIGAGLFAFLVKSLNLSNYIIPDYMQIVLGVLYFIGIIVICVLGYLLGKNMKIGENND